LNDHQDPLLNSTNFKKKRI